MNECCFHFLKKEIRNRILIDLEFDVFQGALSHANAEHSCKLMRQTITESLSEKQARSVDWKQGTNSCSFKAIFSKAVLEAYPKTITDIVEEKEIVFFNCAYFLALPQKVTKRSSA